MILRACMIATLACVSSMAQACGPDTDCEINDGHYRIRMPDGDAKGAIVFAHGYRGSAQGTMNNKSLARLADRLGVALIAIKSYDQDWTIAGAPSQGTRPERDEVAYVGRVVDDAVGRFDLDPDRFIASGFSAGGMLVWTLACHDSDRFAAFVPLSGTFWQPEPTKCTSPPANLIHYHGTTDEIVPLRGRPIGPTHQGDLPKVIEMYRAYGGYDTALVPDPEEGLTCAAGLSDEGARLELCTFEGGHTFKSTYIERVWHMFLSEEG